jgi:3-mercaptopyruvate sulfurtransferase SseA
MSVALMSVAELLPARSSRQFLTIIDARPIDQYRRGHIPGALSLDWTAWCGSAPSSAQNILHQPGYWVTLADRPQEWYVSRLQEQGVSSTGPILVYADGPRSKGRDGRIAWMLLYLGARLVSLLDGGWHAWRQAGGRVEKSASKPDRGRFHVAMQPQRRSTRIELAAWTSANPHGMLIDT